MGFIVVEAAVHLVINFARMQLRLERPNTAENFEAG